MTLEAALIAKYAEGILDFRGLNLAESNFSNIDLSGINLSQANLSVANFSSANLSKADLTNAQLNVARLSGANLTDAILNGCSLNVANLVRADLSRAQLCGASLVRGELVRADLTRANLSDANLNGADLREATLRQANLRHANLSDANLRGCLLKEANLEMANLQGTELGASDLSGANLRDSELRQANLSLANLTGADLRGANLRWVDLQGANLNGADLSEAKLSGANLTGADLTNANLTNTSFVHANLTQAKLIKVEWNGADLSGATLTGAKLHGTPRFGLKIEGIVCQWVDLSASGDRSIIQNFTPEETKEFFNATPPSIRIIVDSPLSYEANFVLAGTYYKIAQEYSALIQPPSIEISNRRTILSFRIDDDLALFSTAFMAILPFQDANVTKKNIYTMVDVIRAEVIQEKNIKSIKTVKQLIIFLSEAMRKAKIIEKTNKNLEAAHKLNFFKAPTRTILTSSQAKNLTIYDNPHFGKKFTNNDDISGESPYTIPDLQVIADFIKEFYHIG
jgi:uncharacterized protein YjbI with pentapeptide repeats